MPFGSPLCLSFEISPPKGLGVSFVDAGKFERGAVGDCAVAVGAIEKDWIVWRDLIEVPARRENWRRPESFNPTAAGDPFARLFLIDALFNFREKIFEAVDAFEVERDFAKADSGKMMMRVSESRQHRLAGQIDDARFRRRHIPARRDSIRQKQCDRL